MQYIPDDIWKNFKTKYETGDICSIAQGLMTTLILIIPKAKIEIFRDSLLFQKLQTDYYDLVRRYTNIKVSKPDDIKIHLESKEDFDANFQGNWYNYFR